MSRKFIICLGFLIFIRVQSTALPNPVLKADGVRMALGGQDPPEEDRAFDSGSRIQFAHLTPLQIENLTTLARVWGFLKYHDPVITAGKRSWDFELFRIMPGVLSVHSRVELNALLAKWIDTFGPIDVCQPCASLDSTVGEIKPDIGWIGDTEYLGVLLAHRLESIYQNRLSNQQYYVARTNSSNPVFNHEPFYSSISFPDSGYQLLGLFRLWNMVEYWYPDRNVIGEDWSDVLAEFIPRIAYAKDKNSYAREMMALIARIHDSHANLWSSLNVRPPAGKCRLPVNVRFIEHHAVITSFTSEASGRTSGVEPGDEITALDGVPVSKLVSDWKPLYAASNEASQLRDMAGNLTSGNCGPLILKVRRGDTSLSLSATRLDPAQAGAVSWTHDLPGPTFQRLSKDVAYLKLSSVKKASIPDSIASLKGTRGLIVDIRNYPSDFVVFALGSLLVRKSTPFVFFTVPDLANPGAFHRRLLLYLHPSEPHYDGKVGIVVDEVTQSQAEYTAMALRSTPNAIVLGSTTAGADGNVSRIPLPGGLGTMMSGLGVFYPDGTATQRIGIHVDVEVHPTVAGIRARRDEVLEAAIRQIVPGLSLSEVEKLARPGQ